MAKRLTVKQKEEILKKFTNGETIDVLYKEFNCTKLTITRNLKKSLGEEKYKFLINKSFESNIFQTKTVTSGGEKDLDKEYTFKNSFDESFPLTEFVEITPLNEQIDNVPQKDLTSLPISEVSFPKIAYLIVDNKIELAIKNLNDFPEWQFLPKNDLNRKTIEIYFDLKIAKRVCSKEHKVIKVPNTDVFKIVAPILVSRGISRIVTDEKLIAL